MYIKDTIFVRNSELKFKFINKIRKIIYLTQIKVYAKQRCVTHSNLAPDFPFAVLTLLHLILLLFSKGIVYSVFHSNILLSTYCTVADILSHIEMFCSAICGNILALMNRDFRDASSSKYLCCFRAKLTVFLEPKAEIAITLKQLKVET